MGSPLAGFTLVDDVDAFYDPRALVVRVRRGLRRRRDLFQSYARQLRLPSYFGWNWDAFEECLGDRSWLIPPRPVALVHAGLPFRRRSRSRQTYLEILRAAAQASPANSPCPLQVIFATDQRDDLDSALATPQ